MNAPRLMSLVVFCVVVSLLGACTAPAAAPAAAPAGDSAEAPAAPAEGESTPPTVDEVSPEVCPPDTGSLSPVTVLGEPTNNKYIDKYFTVEAEYQNPEKSNQTFRLNITSQDPARAMQFAKELLVCFEAVDTGVPDTLSAEEGQEEDISTVTPAWEDVLSNPAGVFVEMFWLPDGTVNSENYVAVFYAIDPTLYSPAPTIDPDGQDGYQAKCALSASSTPTFLSGGSSASVTATLYRRGSSVGSSTASASSPYGAMLSNSNGRYRTVYDTTVGGNAGTKYSLSGSWIENNSGITSSMSWCTP